MADISAQVAVAFQDGTCDKVVLFAVKGATAGDTFDVGPYFRVVKRAGLVSATGTTIAALTAAGTVLTVPTGPSNDGLWVVVVGVAT